MIRGVAQSTVAPTSSPVLNEKELRFLEACKDVAEIVEALLPHFKSTEDLLESVRLATVNPGQLKLLLNLFKEQGV